MRRALGILGVSLLLAGCPDNGELYDFDGDGSLDADDCGPSDPEIYPGAPDPWDPEDPVDSNCDGGDGIDLDGDGYPANQELVGQDIHDCNDNNEAVNPGSPESCNATDDDCDTLLDEDFDVDADTVTTCGADGVVGTADDDCDDNEPTNFPGNPELCDGYDNDCDPTTESLPGGEEDSDNDDDLACEDCDDTNPFLGGSDEDGDGSTECDGDCDDSDVANFPGNLEVCDGQDNDCDLTTQGEDEVDFDNDGSLACDDCDDDLASGADNFPGNIEICDGQDNDCNGLDDFGEQGTDGQETDDDGDGQTECEGDCDDSDVANFLGNLEICDGQDNDCDGATEADATDTDADGWLVCGGDCDDSDPEVHPGHWDETGDSLDQDCDGDFDSTGLSSVDYSFVGENNDDMAGYSVSSAGDVDGDGLDDLLVGASEAASGGKAYLVLGSSLGATSTINLSSADYSFVGEAGGDFAGGSVSSAGDVDGDGLDDLLVGAREAGWGGKAYLVLGSSLGATSTINLSSADYIFQGEGSGDMAGTSVSSAGDVDGDGLGDLLVGAPYNNESNYDTGKTYLILGSSLPPDSSPVTIALSSADYSFVGNNTDDFLGRSVSSAGDVDGDGRSDLLLGAYGNSDAFTEAGKVCLILGSSLTSLSSSLPIPLSSADYSFRGENADDYAGISVSSAGDVDGDGLDDLLVGAEANDDGGSGAGKAYLVLGSSLGATSTINLSLADYSFVGEAGGEFAGGSVSSAGDVDGDGLDDLLVGAREAASGGKVYLILGSSLGVTSTIDLSQADYIFQGEDVGDMGGTSVSSAGDVDGDGVDDLLVGASSNDEGGSGAGKAYLLLSPFATPDYEGLWTLTPTTSYSCSLATAALDHLVIDHVAPYATVSGMPELTMDSSSVQPGLLEGDFTTTDVFDLSRTESLDTGNCSATWSFAGSYTSTNSLTADFGVAFTGSCGDCTAQTWAVTGTP